MKKILSMALAVIIAVGSVTAYAVEAESEGTTAMADGDLQVGDSFIEGDLEYTVLDDGTLEVSCPSENKGKFTEITIPSAVNGKSVTSIGDDAFIGCSDLTSVTIPDGITSIGYSAFYGCTSLISVTIPDSVIDIGLEAFKYCTSLTKVTLPDGITSIGYGTFTDCGSLTTVTIPNSVTSIGDYAFAVCESLTTLTIPNSVTSIGEEAFNACASITSINVDPKNEYYCSVDGILFDKDKAALIQYPIGKTEKNYMIPNSVTSIGNGAFSYCTSLTSVTIPDSVTSIGNSAFSFCKSLTTVTIPDSVNIGAWAFEYCTSLTTVTIPDSVTDIGQYAFRKTPFLENQTEPLKYAGKVVIDCDKEITDVIFKEGTVGISDGAFSDCTSLTTITIPNSVTKIRQGAFRGCTSLTTVTIPDSVTSISNYAFSGSPSLTAINVGKGNNNYCSENGVLFNKDKTTLIIYPAGKTDNSYTIPESVTSINSSAFQLCTSLASVTIPNGMTSIEFGAFKNCTSLTSVTIPNSVTRIRTDAFKGCTDLKDIYYSGAEEEWGKININSSNKPLTTATIHYNSIGPDSVQIDIAKPESGSAPDTSGMKVEIGGGEKPQTITISADGKLDLSGMADGKYSFTFSANNCAPRKYSVTVLNGTASGLDGGVELHLYGDISGDGKITNSDVLKANASARKTKELEGYELSVADITGDGKITNADVLKINAHARNTKTIW